MSSSTESKIEDTRLQTLAEMVGLHLSWQRTPDEVREAYALAETYVSMLPAEVDAQIAPWVFPGSEAASS